MPCTSAHTRAHAHGPAHATACGRALANDGVPAELLHEEVELLGVDVCWLRNCASGTHQLLVLAL